MYAKNRFRMGASVIFEIPSDRFNERTCYGLLKDGLDDYQYKEETKFNPQRHRILAKGTNTGAFHNPKYPSDVAAGIDIALDLHGRYDESGLGYQGPNRFLGLHLQAYDEYLERPEKFQLFLDLLPRAFDILQVPYGWGDDFDHLLKFKKKDPRRHAFGLNFYGREAVAKIGRDRVLSAPAWRVDQRPWGGIIVQLVEKPFHAIRTIPDETREALRKHLRLEEIEWE